MNTFSVISDEINSILNEYIELIKISFDEDKIFSLMRCSGLSYDQVINLAKKSKPVFEYLTNPKIISFNEMTSSDRKFAVKCIIDASRLAMIAISTN